jgi:hypothetical protein
MVVVGRRCRLTSTSTLLLPLEEPDECTVIAAPSPSLSDAILSTSTTAVSRPDASDGRRGARVLLLMPADVPDTLSPPNESSFSVVVVLLLFALSAARGPMNNEVRDAADGQIRRLLALRRISLRLTACMCLLSSMKDRVCWHEKCSGCSTAAERRRRRSVDLRRRDDFGDAEASLRATFSGDRRGELPAATEAGCWGFGPMP